MTRPKGSGGKAKPLTHDEIKRIDKCLTGTLNEERDRLLLYLGLGSGMRIGELTQLTVGDVAPYGKVLDEILLQKQATKEGRARRVYLAPQAVQALKHYLEHLKTISRIKRLILAESDDGCIPARVPLFWSQKRPLLPLSANTGAKVMARLFKLAAVSGASSHSLRRTHANALRRAGVDLKVIQEQLGHASLAITERYFEVDPLEKRAAVARLRF